MLSTPDALQASSETPRKLGARSSRVYRHEIEEQAKTLKLWVRRKRGNRKTGLLGLWAEAGRSL
jgi:hypothetical protein